MMPAMLAEAAAGSPQGWLVDRELVDPAFSQAMADGSLQTSIPPLPPPPETPGWLLAFFQAIRDFLSWATPAFTPIAWVLAALLALFLLYRFVPAFARWVDNLPLWRRKPGEEAADEGEAEAVAARALLAEADALAREGRFAEAVHLLLHRSVEDISERRPGLVRPALTARALARADALPAGVRGAFARIARAVEISLFGGRAIDADAWDACRAAYADLTIARNWVAA